MDGMESKESLYELMDKVVARLGEDEAFQKRIARADMSCAFVVPKLDASYAMFFKEGSIEGKSGLSSGTTIKVTCPPDVLDGLMSGKLSGTSAYFSGKLKLQGDEWRAQTIAGYLRYIAKAYNALVE